MPLDALIAANAAYYAAFSNRDASAMERIWCQQHPVICAHPGWPLLEGRDAVLQSYRSIFSGEDSPRLRCINPRAMQGNGLGCVVCTEVVENGELLATNVFVLEEGEWKMVHHHAGGISARQRPQRPTTDGGWKN